MISNKSNIFHILTRSVQSLKNSWSCSCLQESPKMQTNLCVRTGKLNVNIKFQKIPHKILKRQLVSFKQSSCSRCATATGNREEGYQSMLKDFKTIFSDLKLTITKQSNYLVRGIQQFKTSTIFALRYGFLIKSGLAMNIIIKFINSSCRTIILVHLSCIRRIWKRKDRSTKKGEKKLRLSLPVRLPPRPLESGKQILKVPWHLLQNAQAWQQIPLGMSVVEAS